MADNKSFLRCALLLPIVLLFIACTPQSDVGPTMIVTMNHTSTRLVPDPHPTPTLPVAPSLTFTVPPTLRQPQIASPTSSRFQTTAEIPTCTAAASTNPSATPSPTATVDPSVVALGRIVFESGWVISGYSSRDYQTFTRFADGSAAWSEWQFSPLSSKQIFAIYANGSRRIQLTTSTGILAQCLLPVWSPDNTHIVFVGTGAQGADSDLYVMDADGMNITRLTSDALPGRPSWSPDGQQLVFSSAHLGIPSDWGSIYVVNADGSGLVQLTSDSGAERSPAWSPNGQKIAFVKSPASELEEEPVFQYAVHVMDRDGTNITQLMDYVPMWLGGLAWSPDGDSLAFTCEAPDTNRNYEICVMNADGTDLRQLTSSNSAVPFRRWRSPTWSPDGRHIAFECTDDVDVEFICVMWSDGTHVERLGPGSSPSWQAAP